MNNKLESYRKVKEDLLKQIELCQIYKSQIENGLQELKQQYEHSIIDKDKYNLLVCQFLKGRQPQDLHAIYDDHIIKCYESLAYHSEKTSELNKRFPYKNVSLKILAIISVLFLLFGIGSIIDIPITGLVGYESISQNISSEDGFAKEGYDWAEIKGSKLYERCLKVNSEADFDAVNIIAKVMRARDEKDLMMRIYNHDEAKEEPSEAVGSCKVEKYSIVFKSCTVNNIKQSKGSYWICALNPEGDSEITYYTIAQQIGDQKKTALWTGENWQTLEGSSYTIKAQFIKNG